MRIVLVTPAPPGSLSGNRASASRWARLLRRLGHRVQVVTAYAGEPADLMVALHAWRSASSIRAFAASVPRRPLVVVLTGTDAYRFIHSDPEVTLRSLELADRLIGLHALISDAVPQAYRHKVGYVVQSARPLAGRAPPRRFFRVCVAGHLREEKDPLRAALAARQLPGDSRIRVDAYGKAHSPEWAESAQREMAVNPRYRWHGEIPHARLRDVYRRSHLLVLSSRMEGGANVVSEAVMADLPVIASRIAGSVGLLGDDYPGYYPVGDADALARLLRRAETDPPFYAQLRAACRARRFQFEERAEQQGWAEVLAEFTPKAGS